jgi:signal transduction histidine kinase
MTVRLRLALTVLLTGLATAAGVLVTVALAFERFEREVAYTRADAFLGRVVALHDDLPAQQRRDPEGFTLFLKSLLLLEPDSQLYLLAPDGTVLASTGSKNLPPGFKVAVEPVRRAAAAAVAGAASVAQRGAAYVMGDDPEYMDEGAVIAARALRQASIRPGPDLGGYLYIVCRRPGLPPTRVARLAAHVAGPALGPVLAVVLLATVLAAWIITAVTRPLAVLSDEVARAARAGFGADTPVLGPVPRRVRPDDEFGRLHGGFQALLATLHAQWDRLRRLDAFRRESVSNLSHDLRSPLTAAAASLETLQQRWRAAAAAAAPAGGHDADRAEEARLVDVALRNTQHAARLVHSLGDLAVLDEDRFRLRLARLDLGEMLDDIAMRFAERGARQGVSIRCDLDGDANGAGAAGEEAAGEEAAGEPLVAEVDVELVERAIANLLDNALRFTPAGGRIVLSARTLPAPAPGALHEPAPGGALHERAPGAGGPFIRLIVQDSGSGIEPADLEHLFDRHFSGRAGHAARAEGGRTGNGLGLAIVRRIVELHGGRVAVRSDLGRGTTVMLDLPPRPSPAATAG